MTDRRPNTFESARDATWRVLPGPVRRWVPATAIGYLAINMSTFALDLGILTLCSRLLQLPYPVAVSCGYGVALTTSYVLNRRWNFHSHGAVGGELVRYVVVVALNFLLWVLGLSSVLEWAGVQYQLSRITASVAEAVFMYCCMRWVVFRRPRDEGDEPSTRSVRQ